MFVDVPPDEAIVRSVKEHQQSRSCVPGKSTTTTTSTLVHHFRVPNSSARWPSGFRFSGYKHPIKGTYQSNLKHHNPGSQHSKNRLSSGPSNSLTGTILLYVLTGNIILGLSVFGRKVLKSAAITR
ncbi:hypothetical protein BDN72DRAFT_96344 [Pluteus cervinus]|uniref:Uncharacterized protein n=1 Tax=Pluteus cervinus TaxID=181527 RepID=A0ACD3APN3_9AGAR|nr:hypothetical protein BDN72DRAFT_96344 [Pluteus cervinus]